MTYIPMIDTSTGEIDAGLVAERALLRAAREFGGPNPPPSYLRTELKWCRDRAAAERIQWRQQRGLRGDQPTVMFNSLAPDTNE